MLPRMSRSSSEERIVEAARRLGIEVEIHHFPEGTKTAEDAARAIQCDVAAIVKTLVFTVDDEPVIALVPGDRKLSLTALASAAGGQTVERASPDVVRAATGFVAGGTPPFGHTTDVPVFADIALRRQPVLWAGGGTPSTVFSLSISDLVKATNAVWTELS